MDFLLNISKETYNVFVDISPYLLIGLFFAGLLHILLKKDFIVKHIGSSNLSSVLKAALLGVPLPLCSCGVIPTALFLRKKKASEGATVSFLISTPQTGIDSILPTYGMLGPIFAVYRPLMALLTGFIGGIIVNKSSVRIDESSENESCQSGCCSSDSEAEKNLSFREKIYEMFRYSFVEFLDDISAHLTVGIVIAGLISALIPDNFFSNYGGSGILGMLYMIIIGLPMYVCATSSIPIAVSLMLKGISPGAAFIFLVVGPATNAATMTLIGRVLGKKILAVYLSVISISAILGGFLLNWLYTFIDIPEFKVMCHAHDSKSMVTYILAGIFLVFLLISLFRKYVSKGHGKALSGNDEVKIPVIKVGNAKTVKVEGMQCNHCANSVIESVSKVAGVEDTAVNLSLKTVTVKGEFDLEKVKKVIAEAGYSVVN
ncbi:MAG: heavy metal-associated domain-containing protein [Candidatus Cloacimonadota bacterium]|nr:MAG: heavy metal-associated domain-containing protein [Candidatus Cloacimonadota bacterium]